jgi:hypothetical protein
MTAADHAREPARAEFTALVSQRGVGSRPLRALAGLLAGDGAPFDELVRSTALPRRAVEAALAALGPDVEEVGGCVRLRADRAAAYAGLSARAASAASSASGDGDFPPVLVATVRAAVTGAPRPNADLDHVAATPETVARRALWLASTFALSGRHVLCLGDHDLTSVALAALDPTIAVTVADIDEDVLAHIVSQPAGRVGTIRALFADFRVGLPARLRGSADLVVTDPPYTPEGVALFARRGLEALADHANGRLVVAYGYGDQPGLGLNVQEALARFKLTYEAVLPDFNRYDGAQAIGSASNLYVLRPTAGTRKAVAAGRGAAAPNLYSHGRQATEADAEPVTPEQVAALVAAATAWPGPRPSGAGSPGRRIGPAGGDTSPGGTVPGGTVPGGGGDARRHVALAVGDAWPDAAGWPGDLPRRVPLAGCLAPDSPDASPCAAPPADGDAVVADLRHDAGPLLLRLLLATRAPRVAVLVPNDHADLADAAGQEALSSLLAGTWALRFRRSTPGPRLAIVEAVRAPVPPGDPAAVARRHVLDRPHAKLANACREALVRAAGSALTKNEARSLVASHVTATGADTSLALLETPRATLALVLPALDTAATLAASHP